MLEVDDLAKKLYGASLQKVYGPYKRNDNRQHVVLYFGAGSNQTVSYPKYLIERELGRLLQGDETVDHINGDVTDNRLENLQVLGRRSNILKSVIPAEVGVYVCPQCNEEFTRPIHRVRANQGKQKRAGPFCSQNCSGQYGADIQAGRVVI